MNALTPLVRSMRSEFVRVRRLWKLPVISLALGLVATVLAFSTGGVGPGGAKSGNTATSDVAALAEPDGIVAGLDLATNFVGLLALVLWALSVARDFQNGAIRVLLVTQARRGTYLGGKLLTLAATAVVTALSTVVVCVGTAFVVAPAQNVSTDAWAWSPVWSALLNVCIGAIGWGALGGMLAVATRSSAAAIAGGVGYLLLGEPLLEQVWDGAAQWLPSSVLSAVFQGGSVELEYRRATLLAGLYVVLAVGVAHAVVIVRDVTD